MRDTVYGHEGKNTDTTNSNKTGKWLVFIILMLLSPIWGIPLIGVILYRGIIKNEALEFANMVRFLAKSKNNNRFSDHEVVK